MYLFYEFLYGFVDIVFCIFWIFVLDSLFGVVVWFCGLFGGGGVRIGRGEDYIFF